MEEGQTVEHIGEPLTLLSPVDVESPQHVAQRFATHGHLRGQRLLGQIL